MGCHAFRGKAGAGLRLARRALAGVCPHVSACVWARHVCRREEATNVPDPGATGVSWPRSAHSFLPTRAAFLTCENAYRCRDCRRVSSQPRGGSRTGRQHLGGEERAPRAPQPARGPAWLLSRWRPGPGVFACGAGCMRCLCLQLGSVRRGTRVTHFAGSRAQCEGTPMSRLNKPAFFLCTRPKPLRQGEARQAAEGDGPAGGPRGSAMRTGEQTSDVRVGCGLRAPGHWSQASEQLSWGRKQMGFGNAGGGHVTTCPSGAFPCHHYTDAGPKGETEAPSPRRLGRNPDTRSRVLCVTRKPWPPSAARL